MSIDAILFANEQTQFKFPSTHSLLLSTQSSSVLFGRKKVCAQVTSVI